MRIDAREFIQALTLPMWQAAAAVRWLEGRVENRPKLDEDSEAKSALTDADCVSQEILLEALRAYYPSVEVEAEEDTPCLAAFASNRSADRVVVDPIDGTLRYVRRDGLYSIIVGLEREGCVQAALVAVPQEDVLIRASRGGGAEIAYGGGEFRRAVLSAESTRLLVSHGLDERAERALADLGLSQVRASGGAIGVSPLLDRTLGAIRISQREEGLSRRAWIAALATQEAGGVTEALDGPMPASYCEGVRGVLMAATSAQLCELRRVLEASA